MTTLEYIVQKFKLDTNQRRMPIEIPNFGRANLAQLFGDLQFEVGVEIGVRDGGYSQLMVEKNPHLKRLSGIDPYEPHTGYRDHVKKSTFVAFEKEAHDKLDRYPNYTFIRDYSANAVTSFADNSLDFVYLDGDHDFSHVTEDITIWLKKLKSGGIMSGDDYFKHSGNARIHVYQAVNGFTDAWKIRPWFVLGTKAIIPDQVRDHGRSWMWIKP